MSLEVVGKIKMIDATKEVGTGGFKKKDLVITTDEQYPQHILIQFVQDKIDLLNGFIVGEDVKVDINLRGREWINPQGESVYFNTIQGWRIKKEETIEPQQTPQSTGVKEGATVGKGTEEEADDLPF